MNRAIFICAHDDGQIMFDSGGMDLTNPEHIHAARWMLRVADDALVEALTKPQEAANDAPDPGDADDPPAG